MYSNTIRPIATSGAITSAGIAALPSTSGDTLGTILAYIAIGIGVLALTSQAVVRIIRHHYAKDL